MTLERPLVVFDTETTGLSGPPHLIELGAVRVERGDIVDHFATLVRPEAPITPEAVEVSGIDDAMVRDAPPAAAALRDFFAFAGDAWLAAHDAPRDAHVLAFECARSGLEPPASPVLDTVALARRLLPESPDHKLETLVHLLDLDSDEQHRALPDAVSTWKVLEECLARMARAGEVSAAALLAATPRVVTLARAAPTAPRLPRRLRPLEAALRGSEPVTLHYGASDVEPSDELPTVRLPVLPRLLYRSSDRSYLEAECGSTGLLKTYRLDRIRRVTSG